MICPNKKTRRKPASTFDAKHAETQAFRSAMIRAVSSPSRSRPDPT